MEILKFIYDGQEIEFEVGKNITVNATEMAKIFGKYPKDFLILDGTKAFINSCLKKENSPNLDVQNEDDLYTSSQKTGTWMHRILALKFAAWLNSDFEVWIYITIDKLLNEIYREQKAVLVERLTAQQLKAAKRTELLNQYPDIQQYFDLEDRERKASTRLAKIIKEQSRHIQLELFK